MQTLCACHTCKQYADIDKFKVVWWLCGEALNYSAFTEAGWSDRTMKTELMHAYRLLRFIFMHQEPNCSIDLIYENEDLYYNILQEYEVIDFENDMGDTPWDPVWQRAL